MLLPARMPVLLIVVFSLMVGLWPRPSWAAGEAIQDHFSAHNEARAQTVDHSAWNTFLRAHVSQSPDGINRLDYARVSPRDRAALEAYISRLVARAPSTLPRAGQLAYWANLYNALTVKVILDHYPVRSIRQIKFGRLFALGPWRHDLVTIEGFELSLSDIEDHILRPIFGDVRVHYALNCASLGCPNLAPEAFDAARIDAQLDAAARAFINHPRGAHFEGTRLVVSSIYSWFREDFGGNNRHIISHLRRYADTELAAQLDDTTRIARYQYDWSLNDTDQEQVIE